MLRLTYRKIIIMSVNTLIVVAWIFMMVLLMKKEGLLKKEVIEANFRSLMPKDMEVDSWKGIYISGKWVGYSYMSIGHYQEKDRSGYVLNSLTDFSFNMFNEAKSIEINTTQILDNAYNLLSFNASISGLTNITLKGKRLGNFLIIEIGYGDGVFKKAFEVEDDLFLENSILSIYRGKGLSVGDSYKLNIFNPLTLSTEPTVVEVVAEEGDLMILETHFSGFSSRSWVDKRGHVVREETANGWVMKSETKEEIERHIKGSGDKGVDILKDVAVITERVIDSPRDIGYMRIRVSGVDLSDFQFDNIRQRLIDDKNGIVDINAILPEADKAILIPYEGEELKDYLEPSVWIQCRDPKIKRKAAEIIGDEKNSWIAAKRIGEWIHNNIERSFTVGIPVASSVLLYQRGDCNEHTVLFVALARAAGIPSEMCAGFVYLDDGFYYHAWPKVYVGKWMHLDPTLGQSIADATHFELVSGDIGQQVKIAQTLGKIKIEVLDAVK